LPHSFDPHHDADRDGSFVVHDESAHRISASDSPGDDHPLHCLACHWARSLRQRDASVHLTPPDGASAKFVRSHVPPLSPHHAVRQPPLRAPPVSPAIA
jgi:hypothetical protein